MKSWLVDLQKPGLAAECQPWWKSVTSLLIASRQRSSILKSQAKKRRRASPLEESACASALVRSTCRYRSIYARPPTRPNNKLAWHKRLGVQCQAYALFLACDDIATMSKVRFSCFFCWSGQSNVCMYFWSLLEKDWSPGPANKPKRLFKAGEIWLQWLETATSFESLHRKALEASLQLSACFVQWCTSIAEPIRITEKRSSLSCQDVKRPVPCAGNRPICHHCLFGEWCVRSGVQRPREGKPLRMSVALGLALQ